MSAPASAAAAAPPAAAPANAETMLRQIAAASVAELSACASLAAHIPTSDNHGTRLSLRLAAPPSWSTEGAAQELMRVVKPTPVWTVVCKSDLALDIVVVWGARQPIRHKLKDQLAGWLGLEREVVKAAFTAAGVGA